jgi:hypothetical protein
VPCGFVTSHVSSMPIECTQVGGITETLLGPSGQRTSRLGRHAVCTVALHQRQRQSCKRRTEPHVLSQWVHFADTGKFPSCHWCGIIRLPSGSSIISLPVARENVMGLMRKGDNNQGVETILFLFLKSFLYFLWISKNK